MFEDFLHCFIGEVIVFTVFLRTQTHKIANINDRDLITCTLFKKILIECRVRQVKVSSSVPAISRNLGRTDLQQFPVTKHSAALDLSIAAHNSVYY